VGDRGGRFGCRKPNGFVGFARAPRPRLTFPAHQVFTQLFGGPLATLGRLVIAFSPALALTILRGVAVWGGWIFNITHAGLIARLWKNRKIARVFVFYWPIFKLALALRDQLWQ
jgi:hypothetical protein